MTSYWIYQGGMEIRKSACMPLLYANPCWGGTPTPTPAAPDSCCLTPRAPTQITGSCLPQPCSVRLELTLCICVNRIPKSSRGKVKKKISFPIGLWKYLPRIELSPFINAFWYLHLIAFKQEATVIREFRVTSASFVLKLFYYLLLKLYRLILMGAMQVSPVLL